MTFPIKMFSWIRNTCEEARLQPVKKHFCSRGEGCWGNKGRLILLLFDGCWSSNCTINCLQLWLLLRWQRTVFKGRQKAMPYVSSQWPCSLHTKQPKTYFCNIQASWWSGTDWFSLLRHFFYWAGYLCLSYFPSWIQSRPWWPPSSQASF